jgi:hypothetical protein
MSKKAPAWVRRCLLFEASFWRRLEERARVERIPVAPLMRALADEALEAREAAPGGVSRSKTDRLVSIGEELLEEVRNLSILIGAVGRQVIGDQQLLLHWAVRDGDLGINEDDLFAELQAAGAEGWRQVLDELDVHHNGSRGDDAGEGD